MKKRFAFNAFRSFILIVVLFNLAGDLAKATPQRFNHRRITHPEKPLWDTYRPDRFHPVSDSTFSEFPGYHRFYSPLDRIHPEISNTAATLHSSTLNSIEPEWVSHYTSDLAPAFDNATAIAVDGSENVYVAGYSEGSGWSICTTIKYGSQTGIEETLNSNSIPEKFCLYSVYPNPFNPTTTFKYELPKESKVVLSVFDMNGRLVKTIVNNTQAAGYYSVQWVASKYSSGVYIYRIQVSDPANGGAGYFQQVRKCLLIK